MKHLVIFLLCLIPGFVFSQTKIRIELLNPDPNFTYKITGEFNSLCDASFTGSLDFEVVPSINGIVVWEAFVPYPPNMNLVWVSAYVEPQGPDDYNYQIQDVASQFMTKDQTITRRVMMWWIGADIDQKRDPERVLRTNVSESFQKYLLEDLSKILYNLEFENNLPTQKTAFSDSSSIEITVSDLAWLSESDFRGRVRWTMCNLLSGQYHYLKFVEEQKKYSLEFKENNDNMVITFRVQ